MAGACSCGSQGALSEIIVVAAGESFGESSERYDFVAEDLRIVESVVGDQGITGSLDQFADHMRDGPGYAAGGILMNVSAKELENWLPRILRGTKSLDTHYPGVGSAAVDIMVKRDRGVFLYTGMQVDKFMLRAAANSEQPSLVEMMITFVGMDEAEGTWPAEPPARVRENLLYWLMADSTLTLNGDEYSFDAFNLQLDNMLNPLMRNSLRPVCIRSEGRRVRFQPRLPMCQESLENLYFSKLRAEGNLKFESEKNLGNSDTVTDFIFGLLYGPKVSPRTAGRTETFLTLDLASYPGDDLDDNPPLKVLNKFPGSETVEDGGGEGDGDGIEE